MSTKFAENILDSMVDENGHCGDRGLSEKQFNCLYGYLEPTDWRYAGVWEGQFKTITFSQRDWEGDIGKYHVVLNQMEHFHGRYSVVSIDLRPEEEVAKERWLEELSKFDHSEWKYQPKERVDLSLVLVREYSYERPAYAYGMETAYIYTFADEECNCYVWKTTSYLRKDVMDENGYWDSTYAEVGDKVAIRATVKAHDEYHGIKQTVITRASVKNIEK